jgi:hypothetical protein
MYRDDNNAFNMSADVFMLGPEIFTKFLIFTKPTEPGKFISLPHKVFPPRFDKLLVQFDTASSFFISF